MRRIAGVLVAVGLCGAACGNDVTPEAPAPEDAVRADALGAGSWSGARTTDDGLLISFVGGREYEAGNPCTVEYSDRTEETDHDVRVEIVARTPVPSPSDEPVACTSEGHFRTLTIPLTRPLGDRRLVEVQFDRIQPVFDGATLLEPETLPAGWSLLFEGPGHPHPEEATSWARTWGPPMPPPNEGSCTPSPAPVTLTQGPPGIVDQPAPNGERTVATHDVGGAQATYAESDTANSRRLTWVARDIGFVLSSSDRCVGDPPTSPAFLVELARSLA